MTRLHRPQHLTALMMYLAYMTAGVFAILFPSHAIRSALPDWAIAVWGSFFVIGGAICAVGILIKNPAVRYVGLPLMISASALYGCSVLLLFVDQYDGSYLFVGILLLATAIGLFERWNFLAQRLRLLQRKERE